MTPARLRWGLIFIQIGILILLVNLDVVNWNFGADLVYALPFLLILIGIEKLFTRSRFEIVSYLAVVTIFLGGLWIAYDGSYGGEDTSFWHRTTYRLDSDEAVNAIKADIRLGDNNLTIRDSSDDLVYGRFSRFTEKPRVKHEIEDGTALVKVSSVSRRFFGGAIVIDEEEINDWTLYFSKSVPLELECDGRDNDIHLNLATTPLRTLTLDVDDAKVYVKLGDLEPMVKVSLDGRNSDIRLRLPTTSGVRFTGEDIASFMERIGMTEDGDAFISEGYDTLENKIDIELLDEPDNLKVQFY